MVDCRNYTSAAVGVIMLIAVITWLATGNKQFAGPELGGVIIEGREPHHTAAADDARSVHDSSVPQKGQQ